LNLDSHISEARSHGLQTASGGVQHPRLKLHRAFSSIYLSAPRDLVVYLPPDFGRNPEQTYPVLFLHDGQNLFDPTTSFIPGQTWQVRESADAAIEAHEVTPLIIVGIYNAGDRRIAEYTHECDWERGGGHADEYGLMLTRELIPFIAARYPIRLEREQTAIGGSSLGGLVSLFLGLRHPAIFGKLAILSPSVWWNNRSILGYLNERAAEIWERPRTWLDVGDREGGRTLKDAEMLARRLKANGWSTPETLHFERVRGGAHDEPSWARRVRPMLRYLFPEAN